VVQSQASPVAAARQGSVDPSNRLHSVEESPVARAGRSVSLSSAGEIRRRTEEFNGAIRSRLPAVVSRLPHTTSEHAAEVASKAP
jgi:hypothetical protein